MPCLDVPEIFESVQCIEAIRQLPLHINPDYWINGIKVSTIV